MISFEPRVDTETDDALVRLRASLAEAERPVVAPQHRSTPPSRRPDRTLGINWSLALVLGVFVAMHVPMAVGFAAADQPRPPVDSYVSFWDSSTWGKYDTWLYLDIAKSGYHLQRCPPESGWSTADWCGSAGWTPTYPALVRLGSSFGVTRTTSAFWWSRIATFAALAVVWFLCFKRRFTASTVGALLLAAVWPGAVYLLALFPMSLVVLASLLTAVLLSRNRPLLAGVCAAVVATSHTTGFYIAAFVVVWIALEHGWHGRRRAIRTAGLFLAPVVAGVVAMLLLFQVTTDHWNALSLSQEKYGHHLLFMPTFLYQRLSLLWNNPGDLPLAPVVQTLLVAVLMLAVLFTACMRWRRLQPIERIVIVISLGFWIAPLLFGRDDAAYYRVEVLTLPAVVVFRRLPAPALYALVGVAAVVVAFMTKLYVQGQLI